jgi:hypothetical protein
MMKIVDSPPHPSWLKIVAEVHRNLPKLRRQFAKRRNKYLVGFGSKKKRSRKK